jgi:hypothetical protein
MVGPTEETSRATQSDKTGEFWPEMAVFGNIPLKLDVRRKVKQIQD